MIVFPNSKINLGLNVMRKRKDGYHDLETIFYPLPFYDVLELIPHPPSGKNAGQEPIVINGTKVFFFTSGLPVDGNQEENLCIRACRLLPNATNQVPSFQMHLHKHIPMGAGLGGGSADGAFTLKLLNECLHLRLAEEALVEMAMRLGSDCPFFLRNVPVLATQRGERMENISIDLTAYSMLLLNPGIHVPTALAFSQVVPAIPQQSIREIIQFPVEQWKDLLVNDFEPVIFRAFPQLATLRAVLYQSGAAYASMTGSGSCLYGLFKGEQRPIVSLPEDCQAWHFPVI